MNETTYLAAANNLDQKYKELKKCPSKDRLVEYCFTAIKYAEQGDIPYELAAINIVSCLLIEGIEEDIPEIYGADFKAFFSLAEDLEFPPSEEKGQESYQRDWSELVRLVHKSIKVIGKKEP